MSTPAFTAWAAAGFGTELLPLCRPGCPRCADRRDPGGKVPHVSGWRTMTIAPAELASWTRSHRGNVGLRTAPFPAFDLDVEEQALADELERVALVTLGSTARRTRANTGRRLLLYRREGEPFGKAKITFPGGAVEILAAGQQCVVAGVHHTGAAIEWPAGQPRADALATMDRAGRDRLLAALRGRLRELGRKVEGDEEREHQTQTPAAATRADSDTTHTHSDADSAAWALDRLSPDCSYDQWIRVGLCIHGQWDSTLGLDLWDAWSRGAEARYPGRKAIEHHWKSFGRGSRKAGLGSLIHMAKGAR